MTKFFKRRRTAASFAGRGWKIAFQIRKDAPRIPKKAEQSEWLWMAAKVDQLNNPVKSVSVSRFRQWTVGGQARSMVHAIVYMAFMPQSLWEESMRVYEIPSENANEFARLLFFRLRSSKEPNRRRENSGVQWSTLWTGQVVWVASQSFLIRSSFCSRKALSKSDLKFSELCKASKLAHSSSNSPRIS